LPSLLTILFYQTYESKTNADYFLFHEPIPKQFLTTADKRLQKENRSNSTIFFPI
jgi:3-hydroxy-3-methylglutaryl CoA synthase